MPAHDSLLSDHWNSSNERSVHTKYPVHQKQVIGAKQLIVSEISTKLMCLFKSIFPFYSFNI